MIPRYTKPEIDRIWSDINKLLQWERVELAAIDAQEELGLIPVGTSFAIRSVLATHPIDEESVKWWKERDRVIKHDLNAFLDERLRFIPKEYHQYWHKGMTSYDTEELPTQLRILESAAVLIAELENLLAVLRRQAIAYRNTIMVARTHGQWAKLQTFGKRILTWHCQIIRDYESLQIALERLKYSKLSGAIGNYQGLPPEVEELVMAKFGFKPFYGATQIVPRNLHTEVSDAIVRLCLSIHKTDLDLRLSARSGYCLMQEPFSKEQKGSSAMPGKKNPIVGENLEGMSRLVKGNGDALRDNIVTWEERAIEQSCVERVAFPDLFHASIRMIEQTAKVLNGLVVHTDAMQREIDDQHGCYATEEVKDFLKKHGEPYDLTHEDCYRIVQLAAFNLFDPILRDQRSWNLSGIIWAAALQTVSDLQATQEDVNRYNQLLGRMLRLHDREVVAGHEYYNEFQKICSPEHQLRNEPFLFKKVFGE